MEPAGKYVRTNANSPEAYGICDLCGLRFNHRDLRWNYQWSGVSLYNTHSLRCWRCVDIANEQLRTLVLPEDPVPILNARTENFAYEEQTAIIMQFGVNLPGTGGSSSGGDFSSDFSSDFSIEVSQIGQPGWMASNPPWAAGPELIMCDQTGEIALVLQYLTSS